MSLLSKLFGAPVKEWEREHTGRAPAPLAEKRPEVVQPVAKQEEDEPDSEPSFFSRILGPSLKTWEQEYADNGSARKPSQSPVDESATPDFEPTGKLQKALYAIAKENGGIPDIFPQKSRPAATPAPTWKQTPTKERARRPGRYLPAASVPDIDGAITSAIQALHATSPDRAVEVIEAAQSRLKGKTVDLQILSERVRAKLA